MSLTDIARDLRREEDAYARLLFKLEFERDAARLACAKAIEALEGVCKTVENLWGTKHHSSPVKAWDLDTMQKARTVLAGKLGHDSTLSMP